MKLQIGNNIRFLRREKDLTQEEVATHLKISTQSVSKWERNEGYPDITLLPAIANYFGVSVDSLLGMNQTDEIYHNYNKQWMENRNQNKHAENVALMREALNTFPNDALLLVQLSSSLERLDGTDEEKSEYLRQSIAVQEQILQYTSDSEVRGATLYNICFSYEANGEHQKALECANKLPNLYKNRENALSFLLSGEEKTINSKKALEPLSWNISRHLNIIAESENNEELKKLADYVAKRLAKIGC